MLSNGSSARMGGAVVEAPSVVVSELSMLERTASDSKNWKALVLKNNA